MNKGCCSKCQAKSKKMKKSKKLEQSSDEETVTQKKVSENENPKTDSHGTSNEEDKKKQNVLTWQHASTKKEKKGHQGNNSVSEKNGVKQPCYTARSMMYHGGRSNPSNRWPISAAPRGGYPAFSMGPMYRPYGGGGVPFQPYQFVPQATMYNGANISPYPPMAAAFPPPYWHRPFMDTNPMTQYTSYADNYNYCFI